MLVDNNTSKDIIARVLQVYQPGFQFIETIQVGFPKVTGSFIIPPRQYTTYDSKALSGSCSMILMTQAFIISLADNLYNKRIPSLLGISFKNMEEVMDFLDQTIVCSYNNVNFEKLILKNDPDNTFEIEYKKIICRNNKDLIYFIFDYSISSGKHTGTWTCAYNKNKFLA